MNLIDLQEMLKRAAIHTVNKTKLMFTAITLFFCGLVMLFGMGVALSLGPWLAQSMYVIPFFVSIGLLLSLGVVLIRSYHDEVKQKEVGLIALLVRSWPTLLGALSLFLPLVLSYLALWISNGLFILISEIPFLGPFLTTVFIGIPFLLHVGILILIVATVYLLFALSPTFALNTLWQQGEFMPTIRVAMQHGFQRFGLFCVGLLPLLATLIVVAIAAYMTLELFLESKGELEIVMTWFFMMLPFTLLLAPGVVFFFNMATEAHILIHKSKPQ